MEKAAQIGAGINTISPMRSQLEDLKVEGICAIIASHSHTRRLLNPSFE